VYWLFPVKPACLLQFGIRLLFAVPFFVCLAQGQYVHKQIGSRCNYSAYHGNHFYKYTKKNVNCYPFWVWVPGQTHQKFGNKAKVLDVDVRELLAPTKGNW